MSYEVGKRYALTDEHGRFGVEATCTKVELGPDGYLVTTFAVTTDQVKLFDPPAE